MSLALKIVGILIIVFGLVDLVGSYADFDLWGGFIGVQLPELLWAYSSYIEMVVGYFVMSLGSSIDDDEEIVLE